MDTLSDREVNRPSLGGLDCCCAGQVPPTTKKQSIAISQNCIRPDDTSINKKKKKSKKKGECSYPFLHILNFGEQQLILRYIRIEYASKLWQTTRLSRKTRTRRDYTFFDRIFAMDFSNLSSRLLMSFMFIPSKDSPRICLEA